MPSALVTSMSLGVAALLAVPQPVACGTMNLLQWNPHWQCFVWNQNNCSGHASALANEFLQKYDVDFANFVEVEDPQYQPPAGWSMQRNLGCKYDQTAVVWNAARWAKSTLPGSSQQGCMATDNRPYILQMFERSEAAASQPGVPDKVVVIGAHFPHPGRNDIFENLRGALASVMKATGVEDVVLIADTNEFSGTPNSAVAGPLGFGGNSLVSTKLENTCCADSAFSKWMTFDRIMTNFGTSMETTVLIKDPIPSWARQVKNGRVGAFHKPILGTLSLAETAATPAGATAGTVSDVTLVV